MKLPPRSPSRPSGFVLLEVVLALAVFSMSAVGLAMALNQMGKAAALVQSDLRVTRVLDSALMETLSLPVLEEGETEREDKEQGMIFTTTIKKLENLETEEGQILQDMFHIIVSVRWYEAGQWEERSAETWRYGRMYQP